MITLDQPQCPAAHVSINTEYRRRPTNFFPRSLNLSLGMHHLFRRQGLGAAELPAAPPCGLKAGDEAFLDEVAFEFCDCAEDVEDQPPVGGRRVDAVAEVRAALFSRLLSPRARTNLAVSAQARADL